MTGPAPVVVALSEAKSWLRILHDSEDPALELTIAAATDVCWGYMTVGDPTWDVATVPPGVKVAILVQVETLWAVRGTDPGADAERQADGYLSPLVSRYLYAYRTPTVQ